MIGWLLGTFGVLRRVRRFRAAAAGMAWSEILDAVQPLYAFRVEGSPALEI